MNDYAGQRELIAENMMMSICIDLTKYLQELKQERKTVSLWLTRGWWNFLCGFTPLKIVRICWRYPESSWKYLLVFWVSFLVWTPAHDQDELSSGKVFLTKGTDQKKSPISAGTFHIFQEPWDIISQAFFHICVKYFSNNAQFTSSKTKANHLFLGVFKSQSVSIGQHILPLGIWNLLYFYTINKWFVFHAVACLWIDSVDV